MSVDDDAWTVAACPWLRGLLPTLRELSAQEGKDHEQVDADLAAALGIGDVTRAAARVRQVADEAGVGPDLRQIERTLSEGLIPGSGGARMIGPGEGARGDPAGALGGFQGLPGDPGAAAVTVWTCPKPPAGHIYYVQHGRDVPPCTEHHVSLMRETPAP